MKIVWFIYGDELRKFITVSHAQSVGFSGSIPDMAFGAHNRKGNADSRTPLLLQSRNMGLGILRYFSSSRFLGSKPLLKMKGRYFYG